MTEGVLLFVADGAVGVVHKRTKFYEMKIILIGLFTITSMWGFTQNEPLNDWIEKVCTDMVQFEDLDKYSHEQIADDVMVDFISVGRYELEEVTDETFTIFVDHGKGDFCSHVTFKYIKEGEDYFLVFDEVESMMLLGKEKKMIAPWIKRVNNCNNK